MATIISLRALRTMIAAGACLCGALPTARAGPARFWITASKDGPIVDEVPTIDAPLDDLQKLYIWGRPATIDGSPTTFKTLQNLSLNLVIPEHELNDDMGNPLITPVVDFLDHEIIVHNPQISETQRRFQFVHDSTHAPPPDFEEDETLVSNATRDEVSNGKPDGIGTVTDDMQNVSGGDIQGFSFSVPFPGAGVPGLGVGPGTESDCYAGDEFCKPGSETSDGLAVWLIAEVGFKTVRSSGINPYFLQIGEGGMNHWNDTSANTQVVFSRNGNSPEHPEYNAHLGRQTTDVDEDAHVWIRALPRLGDYDRDDTTDSLDYAMWKDTFGDVVTAGSGADGNKNGIVDAGDYTVWRNHTQNVDPHEYLFWKKHFGEQVPPGTSGDYNGNGIVDAADYTVWRNGRISIGVTGTSSSGGSDSAAPEPSALALVAIGSVLVGVRRQTLRMCH
jgi:hypothetical protein